MNLVFDQVTWEIDQLINETKRRKAVEKHIIDVDVYKDYQFEQSIAAHAGSGEDKSLAAICDVGKSTVEYEVRWRGKPFGARTRNLELAVEVYNSI